MSQIWKGSLEIFPISTHFLCLKRRPTLTSLQKWNCHCYWWVTVSGSTWPLLTIISPNNRSKWQTLIQRYISDWEEVVSMCAGKYIFWHLRFIGIKLSVYDRQPHFKGYSSCQSEEKSILIQSRCAFCWAEMLIHWPSLLCSGQEERMVLE